ncbi:MAG: restriction endonuclease subunit S [Chitinophagales bacterium]|nr:restriction endonuclease subunit S [Chitinophagales bacterium]
MIDTMNLQNGEWKEVKLGDVANIVSERTIITNATLDNYISTENMINNFGGVTSAEKLPNATSINSFKIDDILFSNIRTYFKKVWQSNFNGTVSPDVLVFRSKDCDSRYLYYQLCNPEFTEYSVLTSKGAKMPRGDKDALKEFSISLPPLSTQTAIASVLSSLDDKIDLLHRQNATLEKMAETLFRQWFVEEAKEDWEEGTLDDILTVKGGTTPSTSEPAYWNGSIHWTSPRDITTMNGLFLFDTERKITELGLSKISSGLLPKGTLLMSSRAPVGVLAFSEVPIAINQGYIAIIDDKGFPKEFIYLWLKTNIDIVHSFSNGSTFMEISKSAFKSIQLNIPPNDILKKFQQLITPLFQKIKTNQTQIRTLIALRDTLLPKLMSGEVKVE